MIPKRRVSFERVRYGIISHSGACFLLHPEFPLSISALNVKLYINFPYYLFHIFNLVFNASCKIVCISSRIPIQIPMLPCTSVHIHRTIFIVVNFKCCCVIEHRLCFWLISSFSFLKNFQIYYSSDSLPTIILLNIAIIYFKFFNWSQMSTTYV